MKNKEKFAKEIVEIASKGSRIAIEKSTGKLRPCEGLLCSECMFDGIWNCDEETRKWAESEYIVNPVISKKDRAFLDYLIEEYKFIARDKNCKLLICEAQPIKRERYWYLSNGHCLSLNRCFNVDFPMIKWEDSEPWLIEDLKKLEVCEEYEID